MADTTADTTSFTPETSSSTNKENNNDPLDTAQWTNYLPETFGIRDAVKQSSYRWCVREGSMWGMATASAMSLHRLRTGSRPAVAGHFFFGTFMVVMLPSYYFCYRRREHHEEVIEAMMEYNKFGRAKEMPQEPPLEQHPFWEKSDGNEAQKHKREFRGMIKERKEWQKPQDQSLEEIFKEK